MFKYLWIVVLVMLFEFLFLLLFKKHFISGIDSIFAIVILGNIMGALVGFFGSLVIDLLAMSFCEFFAMEEYTTIASDISTFATILGAFVGFIFAIDEERK